MTSLIDFLWQSRLEVVGSPPPNPEEVDRTLRDALTALIAPDGLSASPELVQEFKDYLAACGLEVVPTGPVFEEGV